MDIVVQVATHMLLVVVGLLPIMNPLAAAPLYLTLTRNTSEAFQRQQARRAALYSFAILATFLLLGNGVIALFGISLAGIRVAGGLIVLVLAFRILFAADAGVDQLAETGTGAPREGVDVSFSPLAMPALAGPASIASIMSYSTALPRLHPLAAYGVLLAEIAIACLLAWATLASSRWLARFLGHNGIQAITRIMGFLMACIAVQFIASGVQSFVRAMA